MWVGDKSTLGRVSWIREDLEADLMNIYNLQELVLEATPQSAEKLALEIIEKETDVNLETYQRIMWAVEIKLRARPMTCVDDLSCLLLHLFMDRDGNEAWPKWRKQLLSDLCMSLTMKLSPMFTMYHLMLVRKLYHAGLFRLDDIFNLLRQLRIFLPDNGTEIMMAYLVFAQEIEAYAPDLFGEFKKTIDCSASKMKPAVLSAVLVRFAAFKENNYKLLNEYLEYGHEINSLEMIIRTDDIDLFKAHASKPGFDFAQRLRTSCFEPFEVIPPDPTLFEYAAVYGSSKVFRYLWNINFPELRQQQKRERLNLSLVGGNLSIIRLLHQSNFEFSQALPLTVKFFRHDLFSWIVLSEKRQSSTFPIHEAAAAGNIRAVMWALLSKQVDISAADDRKNTALHMACEAGQRAIVKLLLAHPFIRPNARNAESETPLMIATRLGMSHIVELFLKVPNTDVNAQAKNGPPLLHIAIGSNAMDTVKVLLKFPHIDVNARNSSVCFLFMDTLLYTPPLRKVWQKL